VPPDTLVAGVPAIVKKQLTDADAQLPTETNTALEQEATTH
jgi:acetyltransferase-like isoleucine patch superfamily enzyme